MIPLLPTLALGLFSFFCSIFVILRIVLPILPPHPLSRRVAPSEFGLPNYRSLSAADKAHVWLAVLDIAALVLFVWQTINEYFGSASGYAATLDPIASLRLWMAMTLRQSCFLVVAGLTLLHVRLARSVSFGTRHWMLWTPTLVLVASSTGIAVVLAGAEVPSLFIGLISYTTSVAVLSSVAFCCVVGTLLAIKRNLAAMEEAEPWPPIRQMEEKPRPSFATEEVDAMRDGASWITSNASSRRNSASAWSFSTHAASTHGGRIQGSSVPAKSSFWFSSSTPPDAPPVPPLPSAYGPLSPSAQDLNDPDPFRREEPRARLGSQTSWLTSTNGSQAPPMSAWSYPTSLNASVPNVNAALLQSHTAVSRPTTPALADAKVLGGYGFAPGSPDAEKHLAGLAVMPGATIDVTLSRALGWLIFIWVPTVMSLPFLIISQQNAHTTPVFASIFLTLSITLSSPILALNVLLRAPFPIPHGIFDNRSDLPANTVRDPAPAGSVPSYKWSHEYKRSTSASVTVVEGRRSGDVWLAKGDAVDGKGKIGRAFGMISPMPKLSVLPPEENDDLVREPPIPIPEGDSSLPVSIHNTTHSEMSAQFGRIRYDSKASSAADESLAYASQVMIAQRHYSAVAKTLLVSGSPEKDKAASTGVSDQAQTRQSTHLRTRSSSSIQHSPTAHAFSPSPPPAFPLPPTPPNVRAARLAQLKHKKSFSSGGFSFGAVDDMNEIDALTAGVLPLLVPGLKVGKDTKIRQGGDLENWTPPTSFSRAKGKRAARQMQLQVHEFGGDFSSPEVHSTPARTRAQARSKKTSLHKSRHFSLPSLGLGKDGIHTLAAEITRALENRTNQLIALPANVDINRRATVFGADTVPNTLSSLQVVAEEELVQPRPATMLSRGLSTRRLGLQSDVPHDARLSTDSLAMDVRGLDCDIPPSAASTATLFELDGDSGPQAESTPHNNVVNKPVSKHRPPPLPLPRAGSVSSARAAGTRNPGRRSSIVYITSPEPPASAAAVASAAPFSDLAEVEEDADAATVPSTIASLAQWSSRVIRKPSSKLQRKISNAVYGAGGSPGSPALRPLALLQERDMNANADADRTRAGTPPLSLRKKGKAIRDVENDAPSPLASSFGLAAKAGGKRSLRTVPLMRTETMTRVS
ncbi:hypothetical protein MKEN_00123800 [Mycena kentingensis (nom. inval.)]|nr:hypothetical protein MKEN_00123800 [Mycena kentingensis (nom. inval.)]